MITTRSTTRRFLMSSLIIVLILTTAIIMEGPPTLTNQVLAKGDSSILARYGYYGYYGTYCTPHPYCMYLPVFIRKLTR